VRMRQVVLVQLCRAIEMVAKNSVLTHLEGAIFEKSLGHDLQNIRRTIASLRAEDLARAVELLVAARRVLVAGCFAAYSVAYYLALALDRIRGNTLAWSPDNGLWASQSLSIGAEDC